MRFLVTAKTDSFADESKTPYTSTSAIVQSPELANILDSCSVNNRPSKQISLNTMYPTSHTAHPFNPVVYPRDS